MFKTNKAAWCDKNHNIISLLQLNSQNRNWLFTHMSKHKINMAKKLMVIQKIACRVCCTSILLWWILSSKSALAMWLYRSAIWLCFLLESALTNKYHIFCSNLANTLNVLSAAHLQIQCKQIYTTNQFNCLSVFQQSQIDHWPTDR